MAAVETPDPQRVRFTLKQPWSDFLTFYASATGAGWIVPKKYVEKVGEDGYKKAPVGAGPYKFVSFTPARSNDKIERSTNVAPLSSYCVTSLR
jgi:peptide/nickel transport system substrate-binding protein